MDAFGDTVCGCRMTATVGSLIGHWVGKISSDAANELSNRCRSQAAARALFTLPIGDGDSSPASRRVGISALSAANSMARRNVSLAEC